jgi:hypothetical protein
LLRARRLKIEIKNTRCLAKAFRQSIAVLMTKELLVTQDWLRQTRTIRLRFQRGQ